MPFQGSYQLQLRSKIFWSFLLLLLTPKRVEHPLSPDEGFEKIAVYAANFPLIAPSARTFLTFADLFPGTLP